MFSLYKCVFEGLMKLSESLSEQNNNNIRRISDLSVRKYIQNTAEYTPRDIVLICKELKTTLGHTIPI